MPNLLQPGQEQAETQALDQDTFGMDTVATLGGETVGGGEDFYDNEGIFDDEEFDADQDLVSSEILERMGPWMILLLPLFIFLALLFMWLSARFNFVLLDVITKGEVSIRESFRRHRAIGNSYFRWLLMFGILALVTFAALVLLAAGLPILLIITVPLILVAVVGVAVIAMVARDFVVPMMYQDGSAAMTTFKAFFNAKPIGKSFVIYILVRIALAIALSIVILLLSLVLGLLAALIVLIGAFVFGLISNVIPIITVLGVVFLVVGVLAFVVLVGLATLPAPIFLRTFAVAYLYRLIPEYNLLGLPPLGSRPSSA